MLPGLTERVPFALTEPIPLSIEIVVALLTFHCSVADWPVVMLVLSAVKVAIVGGAGNAAMLSLPVAETVFWLSSVHVSLVSRWVAKGSPALSSLTAIERDVAEPFAGIFPLNADDGVLVPTATPLEVNVSSSVVTEHATPPESFAVTEIVYCQPVCVFWP